MIRRIFILLLFFSFLFLGAYSLFGKAILRGKSVLQNSGGKPVEGVKISAFGATLDYSDGSGFFELIFPDKNPGDTVVLTVDKKGLEVVNRDKLKKVVLKKNPDDLVEIVMCKEGERDKFAAEYYGIAVNAINENYKKGLEEIKKKYEDNTNKIIAELAKLKDKKDAALAQAKELSEKFAKINLDQASELYKKAFNYFREGDIDKALEVLDDAKIDAAIRKKKEEIKKWIDNYMLKAQFYITKLQFDKAETYYEKAIEAEPGNFDNLSEFNNFLYKQNRYKKPLDLDKKALALAINDSDRASILNSLGVFYGKNNNFPEALKAYQEALEIRRELAVENPGAYLPDVAKTLNNVGILYSDTKRFPKALKAYKEALEIRRKLAGENPGAYLPDVAMILNNLGVLNLRLNKFTDALSAFNEALEIREKLAKDNPVPYDLDLCETLINFGILYKILLSKNPDQSYKEKGLSAVNRAITTLKKYPNLPRVKEYMKMAKELKEYFENASVEKNK